MDLRKAFFLGKLIFFKLPHDAELFLKCPIIEITCILEINRFYSNQILQPGFLSYLLSCELLHHKQRHLQIQK